MWPEVCEIYRSLAIRVEEHHDSACNNVQGQPLGDRYCKCHSTEVGGVTVFRKVDVLATESDRARRRIREEVNIRDIAPETNTSAGEELM